MGFGTKQAREAHQSGLEDLRRTVEELEKDETPGAQSVAAEPSVTATPAQPRATAASFFTKSNSQAPAAPVASHPARAPAAPAASQGRPTAFNRPQAPAPAVPAGRPRAFGAPPPAQAAPAASPSQPAGGFRDTVTTGTPSPVASIPMPAPRGLQQLRLERLIEEVAKVRGVKASALQEMIANANAKPQEARAIFEQAYRDEVLPLRENMVRDMASARSQNPEAVVFLLSDPQNKKSRVIVLDQADARTKGLNLLDNATLVCQTSDYTPFGRPADVFGEGRGLSDDATQQETRRSPRP